MAKCSSQFCDIYQRARPRKESEKSWRVEELSLRYESNPRQIPRIVVIIAKDTQSKERKKVTLFLRFAFPPIRRIAFVDEISRKKIWKKGGREISTKDNEKKINKENFYQSFFLPKRNTSFLPLLSTTVHILFNRVYYIVFV